MGVFVAYGYKYTNLHIHIRESKDNVILNFGFKCMLLYCADKLSENILFCHKM